MIIVGLLGGHAVLILSAVTLAVGGTGRGVVPDYYERAVTFDQHKADLAASAELGWQVTIRPGSLVDAEGIRLIVVSLHDAENQPISDAEIALRLTRLADGQVEAMHLHAVEDQPGQYQDVAELPMRGRYTAELLAERDGWRFIEIREIELAGGQTLGAKAGGP